MFIEVARQFIKEAIGDREASGYLVTDTLLDQRIESNRQLMAEALPVRNLYRTVATDSALIVLTSSTTTASRAFEFAAEFPSAITNFVRFSNQFVILRLIDNTGDRFVCKVFEDQNKCLNKSSRQSLDNSDFDTNRMIVPVFFDGQNFLITAESSPITAGTVGLWQIDFAYITTPTALAEDPTENVDRLNEVHEYLALMLAQAEIQQTNKGKPQYQQVRSFILDQLKEVGP